MIVASQRAIAWCCRTGNAIEGIHMQAGGGHVRVEVLARDAPPECQTFLGVLRQDCYRRKAASFSLAAT